MHIIIFCYKYFVLRYQTKVNLTIFSRICHRTRNIYLKLFKDVFTIIQSLKNYFKKPLNKIDLTLFSNGITLEQHKHKHHLPAIINN